MQEKKLCHRSRRSRQTVYDESILDVILSNYDWNPIPTIKDDPTEDYELFVGRPKRCADSASLTQPRREDLISSITMELLKKRKKLKLDPNVTHLARLT
ncbi:hypothetical protein KIN20_016344 [Parelaphostrongylus tenuis]|uniref:Uncharacterized protein n=1 Tax=Parelaphostrongylus tenuis TaxID=148309 RepID=A0AAD5MHA0_PARTN|nr:hypothetical protein KIN20_016344 [Parelaphostrongylus tenuis]